MKLKLDEDLGRQAAERFRAAGHQVATVHEQGLSGASDRSLIEACRKEGRCLVSLDLDFANPLLFRPSEYRGIAVLRLPPRPTADDLFAVVDTLVAELAALPIQGKLWVVQRGKVREYQPEQRG